MNKYQFRQLHRTARIGNLGTLACSLPNRLFQWFLAEVYDPRFPHIGPGGYKPKGPRLQWQDDGDNDDAAIIAAEYLQRTIPT